MNIPTWEEFSFYLKGDKKMDIPSTFYGKYEYIRNWFLTRQFNEFYLKQFFSEAKRDLYYRDPTRLTQTINEYIYITRLIVEYNEYQKKQSSDIVNSGSLPMSLTWEDMRKYYYVRKHNRSEEGFYKGKFNEIQQYFKDKPFTTEHIEGFLSYLQDRFKKQYGKDIATSYYNKYLSILRVMGELLKTDIVKNFQGFKTKYEETEVLTTDEFERLLMVKRSYQLNSEAINHRWNTLIKTMIITTCRPGELKYATWDDLKGNYLYFAITKNGSPHKVYLPDSLLVDINKLKGRQHNFIFGGNQGSFEICRLNEEILERCRLAGINKHITARSLRGTGITSYLKKYNPHQVAKISNHKTIDTIYRHYYKPDENEIRDIVRHNEIMPEDPTNEEILQEYKNISQKFKKTSFNKYIPDIERYIENLLYR